MVKQLLLSGTVHNIPDYLALALRHNPEVHEAWNDITPLARNEWICLILSTENDQTRARRMKRMFDQLARGQRRPCCWTGCPHRIKNGR